MKRFAVIVLAALVLSGCGKTTVMPQNQMRTVRNTAVVELAPVHQEAWPAVVKSVADALPKGRRTVLILAGPSFGKEALARAEHAALAALGSEVSITRREGSPGRLDMVLITDTLEQQATRPTPFAPYWFSSDAVDASFGVSTEANLAAQLAYPNELAMPQRTGSPNPVAAAGAVERYQKGEVRALREQEIEAGKTSE